LNKSTWLLAWATSLHSFLDLFYLHLVFAMNMKFKKIVSKYICCLSRSSLMMPGPMLSDRLESKQKEFEERYDQIFNVNNKVQVRCVG
jgi:hypothetical protein